MNFNGMFSCFICNFFFLLVSYGPREDFGGRVIVVTKEQKANNGITERDNGQKLSSLMKVDLGVGTKEVNFVPPTDE